MFRENSTDHPYSIRVISSLYPMGYPGDEGKLVWTAPTIEAARELMALAHKYDRRYPPCRIAIYETTYSDDGHPASVTRIEDHQP